MAERKLLSPDRSKGRAVSPPLHQPCKEYTGRAVSPPVRRPCKEHTFLTDVADVRVMEQGLIQLLEDFHSGKLQAFGSSETFDKLDEIREKQEQLAHLHFELDLQQDMRRLDTEEARARNNENLTKMIEKLHGLSSSIQQIQRNPGYENQGQSK